MTSKALTPLERKRLEFRAESSCAVSAALHVIDEQAAVLERVRELTRRNGMTYRQLRTAIRAALSSAPAQAAEPDVAFEAMRGRMEFWRKEHDRAEARVAELEAQCTTLRVNNRVLEADNADKLDAKRALQSRVDEAVKILEDRWSVGADAVNRRALEVLRG